MSNDEIYITITGEGHYYSRNAFKIGMYVSLKKELENFYDDEAIRVDAPFLGTVGYVANSPYTVAEGTSSAGRLYDKFASECMAMVKFMTHTKIIAKVIPNKTLKVTVKVDVEED